jgi:colicin import membrane protein
VGPTLGRFGPALRRRRLPMAALTVSAIAHGIVGAALGLAIAWGGFTAQKVYVVNLVPSIAAVGSPTAPPAPALPPRLATPAPVKPAAPVLPEPREARMPDPPKAPSLPDASLPSTRVPPRPAAMPRSGEKELPPLAPPAERRPITAAAKPAETPTEARPTPPPPAGTPTGSTSGTGVRTLDVTDFPHAWYLRQVLTKVEAAWQRQGQIAEPPEKPLVIVEIQRDGSIATPRIEKSSGNAFYDQAALRAIMEARPFPPLPKDWTRPTLGVMFSFDLERGRG